MPFTEKQYLPSYAELTVPEIKLTTAALKAASLQMGKYCDNPCKEFILCKKEYKDDPRMCVNEANEVTRCGMEFLQKVKKNCGESFTDYWRCLDTCVGMKFRYCRDYQKILDDCIEQHLGQTRPEITHFMKTRLHESVRPKPPAVVMPEPIFDYNEAEAKQKTKTQVFERFG